MGKDDFMAFARNFEHRGFADMPMEGKEPLDRALRREIFLARHIQTHLLQGQDPVIQKGRVLGCSIPARIIGGDYYDFYPLPGGGLRIIIGDVMGKGIPAAMLMILTRGAFRSAAESNESPSETLTAMNNALYEDLRKLGSFVTVFCADWNPEQRLLTYSTAGHSPPLIIRNGRKLEKIPKNHGIMLGGLPHQTYSKSSLQLESGDLVFFYTDGIVDAQNPSGEMFRLERLVDLLVQCAEKQPSEIKEAVIDSIQNFTEGHWQKDDMTMVILKID